MYVNIFFFLTAYMEIVKFCKHFAPLKHLFSLKTEFQTWKQNFKLEKISDCKVETRTYTVYISLLGKKIDIHAYTEKENTLPYLLLKQHS